MQTCAKMFKVLVQCILVICFVFKSVRPMEKTSMYVKRSEVSDQSMSGSGYSYNGDYRKPEEYSFELDNEGRAVKILRDLGYDPFADSQRYAEEHLPLPYGEYTKEYKKPVTFFLNKDVYNIPEPSLQDPPLNSHINEYSKIGTYPAYPYAPGYHHKHFLRKGGKSYNDFGSSKNGGSSDTDYSTVDKFSKGLSGQFDNKDVKSYYDGNGGKKHLVFDKAGNYGVKYASGKGAVRGSFGHKDYHDKGSKTTGYHKVYHKDDYNKQNKFYDKADKSGNFDKYGDFSAQHDDAEGHLTKWGHHDSGYENDKSEARDLNDKGKFEELAKGFRKADGDESFYNDYADYGKKGEKQSSSISGYSE